MEDSRIVELFFERSENAITESAKKYGKYCHYIAYSILYSNEDAEECVNDTYMKAWCSIPPHRPTRLSTYLGKITRNLAIDKYSRFRALKRSPKNEVVLDEVEEFLTESSSDYSLSDEIALKKAINDFVGSLPWQTRVIFVRRYWYMSDIAEIANDCRLSESNVKVILHRTRKKFKDHLLKEGISI